MRFLLEDKIISINDADYDKFMNMCYKNKIPFSHMKHLEQNKFKTYTGKDAATRYLKDVKRGTATTRQYRTQQIIASIKAEKAQETFNQLKEKNKNIANSANPDEYIKALVSSRNNKKLIDYLSNLEVDISSKPQTLKTIQNLINNGKLNGTEDFINDVNLFDGTDKEVQFKLKAQTRANENENIGKKLHLNNNQSANDMKQAINKYVDSKDKKPKQLSMFDDKE